MEQDNYTPERALNSPEELTVEEAKTFLTQRTYDALKWIAQYFLPGAATLYFTLGTIWTLPYGEQVVGTIAAVTTFLGVILGMSKSSYISSGAYADGVLKIDTTDATKDIYSLILNSSLENLEGKTSVTFKIDEASRQ